MKLSTLNATFRTTFDRETLTADARRLGAFERTSKVASFDFVLALLSAIGNGPERSIAAVRRQWEVLTQQTITPDPFEDRFNVGMVRLLWDLIHKVFATSNRALRRGWPEPLRELHDILVIDGTRMAVDAGLAAIVRSTTPGQSALKLIGAWSLGQGHMTDVRAGAAIHHDRKLLRLGTLVAGALYLLDLGFYDHGLFADYDAAHAFFVSRLKTSVRPSIATVAAGVAEGSRAIGRPLDGDLTYGAEVDVDAQFSSKTAPSRTHLFRVVKLDIALTTRHGKPTGELRPCWYVTNLPRETWTVAMIAALYRLRWAIERVWREAKHLARLDHLRSERPAVLFIFMAASLLLHALSDQLIRLLALERGVGAVSRDRVLASLIAVWPYLARELHKTGRVSPGELKALAALLEREGKHPNPNQPRQISSVFKALEEEASRVAKRAA